MVASDGVMHIIPPYHHYYLPQSAQGFVRCFDVDVRAMSPVNKMVLCKLKYHLKSSRGMVLQERQLEHFRYLEQAFAGSTGTLFCNDIFGQLISDDSHKAAGMQVPRKAFDYLGHAEAFANLLSVNLINHSETDTVFFTKRLNIHEKTLYRACKSVYELGPKDIVNYHLGLQAMYFLTCPQLSMKEIASCLGFGESTTFSHFFKAHFNECPTTMRRAFIDNNLVQPLLQE